MILQEYYKRYEIPIEEDLSTDGIGLTGGELSQRSSRPIHQGLLFDGEQSCRHIV